MSPRVVSRQCWDRSERSVSLTTSMSFEGFGTGTVGERCCETNTRNRTVMHPCASWLIKCMSQSGPERILEIDHAE